MRDRISELIKSLKETHEMVKEKESFKPKRIQSLVETLAKESVKTADLIKDPSYTITSIKELISGTLISKSWLNLKVIGSVSFQKSICLTIIAID